MVANVVIPTSDYVPLASHYGFTLDLYYASEPQSKGYGENLCAQRDLAVPLLNQSAIDGTAIDLRIANAAASAWCAEVNAAMHSVI